jgi:hypothetical protein
VLELGQLVEILTTARSELDQEQEHKMQHLGFGGNYTTCY